MCRPERFVFTGSIVRRYFREAGKDERIVMTGSSSVGHHQLKLWEQRTPGHCVAWCENTEHQGTVSHGVRTQNTRALCHMVCWFNSWLSHQWSVSSWLLLRWVTFHWFSTWYVTNHAGQLSLLPSVGWETSSSQGSVAVLCGQKCKKWSHTAHVADSGAVAPSSVNFNHSVKKFTDSSPILSYWSRRNNTYSLQYLSWNRLSTIKLFF